jgi:activator of HSP90 ATPase
MGAIKGPPAAAFGSSRRQWIVAAAAATGGLIVGARRAIAATDDGLSHTAEAIHQEPTFKASPERVYQALMDAKQFQKIELLGVATKSIDVTSKPAQISREAGGAFTLFGGYIVGRHIDLVPNHRIVQAWHEESWPEGIYSIARFELTEQGTGTKLVFDHTGFPAGAGEHLAAGWKLNYWEPLGKFLAT